MCSCRIMVILFSVYIQVPTPQLLLTIFYCLCSNIAFNQTIINSFSLLHLCECFFQGFPRSSHWQVIMGLFCMSTVLTDGCRNKHVHWGFISYYWLHFYIRHVCMCVCLCVCVWSPRVLLQLGNLIFQEGGRILT